MIGKSLAARMTLLQQLMSALMIVAFGASSLWLTNRTMREEEERDLVATARRIASSVGSELEEEHDFARAAASALGEESPLPARVEVYDSLNRLVASTEPTAGRIPARSLPPPGHAADRQGWYRAVERVPGGGLVVASMSDRARVAHVAALRRALLFSAAPLLLITLLMSRWTARRALRPLIVMEGRARDASVESGVRSLGEVTGVEEVDRLMSSFHRLLERLDDLLRSERRFTSNASHELRTPLTVLSGEIEMALTSRALPPEVRASLLVASAQAVAMQELIEALLLFRRATEGPALNRPEFEPVNLSDLVADAVSGAQANGNDRGISFLIRSPDEVMVSGHPVLLAAAVRNLVGNAIKFNRPSGRVTIAVESGESLASLTVDDEGRGVPLPERERVFEAFYRGAEARAALRGFGLGLPLLRQVARAHGGEVTVCEAPTGGARFVLSLPAWRSSLGVVTGVART